MKTIKSTKNIHGTEYTVSVNAPSMAEWTEHFAKGDGLERMADDYNQHKVANNLATALKGAVGIALGKTDTENPKAETVAKGVKFLEMLKAGETFDLRDFVSAKARAEKDERIQRKDYDAKVALIQTKWEKAPADVRKAFLAAEKLDTELWDSMDVPAVLAAFNALYKPVNVVETESFL